MIDIKELTHEELLALCDVITYAEIKRQFIEFPKGYNTLIKTVPVLATRLSDDGVRKIILQNKSKKFITDIFNGFISSVSNRITITISNSVKQGQNHTIALCEALNNSAFCENIDLYFRVVTTELDSENISLVKNITELLRKTDNSDFLNSQILELQRDNSELKNRISESESRVNFLNAEIERISKEKSLAEKAISELQISLNSANSELEKFRSENEIPTKPSVIKFEKNPEFEYSSICKVCKVFWHAYKEMNMLKRLADIDENGEIVKFVQSEGSRTFHNRDMLYMDNADKTPEDTIGVWDWKAIPKGGNPDDDYIKSSPRATTKPIVRIKSEFQFDELKSILEKGTVFPKGNSRFMFVVRDQSECLGVVVSEGEYMASNDLLTIKSDVVCLPKYKISEYDFVEIGDETYYKFLDLRNFAGYEPVKDISKIVKDIIIERATWKAFNAYGYNSREWSGAKSFLENIPTKKLIDNISDKCKCSAEKAQKYLDEFIACANDYLSGNSDDNYAMLHAIKSSPELFDRCIEIARTDWERENSAKIKEANGNLSEILAKIEEYRTELTRINNMLSEKEKLADEVDRKVSEKIRKAQNNAADFISEMAFAYPTARSSNESCLIKSGEVLDIEENKVDSFDDWLEVCYENFLSVGVDADEFGDALAAIMYIACESKIPLIMSGPQSKNIADAFSISRYGKTAAYVNCFGDFSNNIFERITALPDKIVVIDNAFSIAWVNQLMNLISSSDRLYIIIQTFFDDLLIEPRGILNYAMPLLTEIVVDGNFTEDNFCKPFFDKNFYFPEIESKTEYNNKFLRELTLNPIIKHRIEFILGNLENLVDVNLTAELTLGIIPTAYILGQNDLINNVVGNERFKFETKMALKFILGENNDDTISIT